MPTTFTPPAETTTWPGHPVERAGQALAVLFDMRNEAEWRDVRNLFVGYASFEETRRLIADQLDSELSAECQAFLRAFAELQQGFDERWDEWKLVLGSVAEEAFRTLLARKYGQHGAEHLQPEGCPHLYNVPPHKGVQPVASMKKKSMDAICWDKDRDCGEMHEVKASILTFGDGSKAAAMRRFKQAVMGQTQGEVWFGFSGFFDPVKTSEDRVLALLGLSDTDEPLLLDILGVENIVSWREKFYL